MCHRRRGDRDDVDLGDGQPLRRREHRAKARAETAPSQAWTAGADAVVLIAHECPDKLVPILERHRDWNLSFVGSGHCHKVMIGRTRSTR